MSRTNTPVLEQAARTALESLYKQRPNHTLRQHCQLVLLKATGRTSFDVGQVVGLCHVSVNSWLKRYQQEGIKGLETKPGRGRKPLLTVAADQAGVHAAVETNRQRIALAKAEWESQRATGEAAVGRDTFRTFLNVLVADTSASGGARPTARTRSATVKRSND